MMDSIYIFKGDSTTFADVTKFLTFNIETDLNLTNWTAEFILGHIKKNIPDISSKSFQVILNNEETNQLLYGDINAIVKLIDDKKQIKTVTNTIPFKIGNIVKNNQAEIIPLSIPQSTEITMTLQIGNKVISDYNILANKPSVNNVELKNNKTLEELGIQPKGNYITDISLAAKDYATNKDLNSGLNSKQPKGDYATKTELANGLAEKQPKGNYATSTELQGLNDKITSTDDEVNQLTGEVSDIKLELPNKLVVGNIMQGNNITLEKSGNNITINSTATGGTSDYSLLTNKPSINNVELSGNKTIEQLGLQPQGDYVTNIELNKKQDKTVIKALTISSDTNLEDNTIFNGAERQAVTIVKPASELLTTNFISQINFSSGGVATSFTAPADIKWFGDDVSSGALVPVTKARYTIMFYSDGVNLRAISQKVGA